LFWDYSYYIHILFLRNFPLNDCIKAHVAKQRISAPFHSPRRLCCAHFVRYCIIFLSKVEYGFIFIGNTFMADNTKLEKLIQKKKALEARIQMISAREKTQERKQDTRRKILIGSYFIDKAKKENNLQEIYKAMVGYLTRDADKKLFSLEEINSSEKQ